MSKKEYYVVSYANWDYEDMVENGAVFTKPTSFALPEEIIGEFSTEKEAMERAQKHYNNRKSEDKDLRWLAYLRVSKRIEEVIKEFK